MKRSISAVLTLSFVLSSTFTVFGQSKRIGPGMSGAGESTKAPASFPEVVPVEGEFVRFSQVGAISDGDGAFVTWRMAFETNNLGFRVYRIVDGQSELVNEIIVPGAGVTNALHDTVTDERYELFDPQGSLGTVYRIQGFALDGSTLYSSLFAPTSVRSIESAVGRTRESLLASALHLNSSIASRGLVLPQDLRNIVDDHSIPPDLPTQQWVAAQKGVKISVPQSGLYRVSRQQLIDGGFSVGGNSANWRLFMNGVEQAIIVGAGDQYIEFIGRAIDTRESATNIYYLLAGDVPGKRIATKVLSPIGGNVVSNNYRTIAQKKERIAPYLAYIINGETENYFGRLIQFPDASQVPFTVTGLDTTVERVVLGIKAVGIQGATHSIKVQVNGHDVGTLVGTFRDPMLAEFLVPTEHLVEGSNILSLNEGVSGRASLFDSVSVSYSRKYLADQNTASFYTPGLRKVDLTGFTTSDIRLFDTTFDADPVRIANLNIVEVDGTFTVKLPSSRAMVAYGLTEAKVLTSPSVILNIPSTLSSTTNAADLIIITDSSPGFESAAEAWANYRRSPAGGQVAVKVVNIVDVYDEYGYGVHTASAINSFLNAARNSWSTPPRYVLLIGDASQDPRNYEGLGDLDHLPTAMVDLISEETGSDEALADFNSDGLAELSIGRISAGSPAEITTVLNKTMAFEHPAQQSLDRGALFAYSNAAAGGDFYSMSMAFAADLPQSMPKQFVGSLDPKAHATLINEMNEGKFIVNYSGHSGTGIWASTSFFTLTDIPSLTNAGHESIYTILNCYAGRFNLPARESLAEALVKAPNGGAVAAWAATAEVPPDVQLIMGPRFYNQVGAGNITRMGDLIRDAKAGIAGSNVGYSWVLIGDPMLKVRAGVP